MSQTAADSRLEKFRKFTVLHMTYLKYIGLWSLDSNSPAFSRRLYYAYNKLIITIVLVFMITLLADLCSNTDNLSIVTDDGCIFAGITIVFFKMTIFEIRRERIIRIHERIFASCRELCKFPVGGEDEILNRYLMFCRACFCTFSMCACILTIGLLFFAPLEDGALPIRARYPFDTTKSPWHEISFFVEFCAVSVGMTAILGMDNVHTNLCNLFIAQLEILNVHFRNCNGRRDTPINDRRDSLGGNCSPAVMIRDDFAKQFGRSVRNHQCLHAIMNDLNEIFSSSILVQMFSSTMMICLTGFQATLVTNKSSIYKFTIYLLVAVGQLFYICWVGNEMIHQSATLAQNQWLSGWCDEFSTETGHLLILSMMFTRRTLNVKAGVFYVLSMETFIAILRGSYSFFALLNTMNLEVDQ